ncbi:MAG: hypothetical protein J6D25_05440, partial [Eggerthellaceae bacterium]|nr:hypothetical protein [Eggerthellaceae bacterium]
TRVVDIGACLDGIALIMAMRVCFALIKLTRVTYQCIQRAKTTRIADISARVSRFAPISTIRVSLPGRKRAIASG